MTFHKKISNAKIPKQNITSDETPALRDLRQNKEVIILPADKGNLTVVLSSGEYEKIALDLLNAPLFRKFKRDPSANTEKRVNDVVKKVAGKVEKNQAQTIAALKVPNKGTRPPSSMVQ